MSFEVTCPPPQRSRPYTGGPQLFFTPPIIGRAVGGADADYHVILPFPCRIFQIASILTPQNSVFFHLRQFGKVYTSNAVVPDGTEQWIAMTAQLITTAPPYYFTVIELSDAIQDFWLDMGHENGAANTLTIVCAASPDALRVHGGPYT